MTTDERAFWNGFIKAAEGIDSQLLNSFPPEVAQYLMQGMDVESAFNAARPAIHSRLDSEVAPIAQKLTDAQGSLESSYIGEELNRPFPSDSAGQQESMAYTNALLNKGSQRMNTLRGVTPNLPSDMLAAQAPMTQQQVNAMPTSSVGVNASPNLPVTSESTPPPTPSPSKPGMPGWAPWAGGAALGAAGLGAWYLNKRKKDEEKNQAGIKPVAQFRPKPTPQFGPKPIK